MNKRCYRIIFNRVRGMLIVVPDIARSGYSGVARCRKHAARAQTQVRISPLSLSLWLAAGVVSLPAQAFILADRDAPRNQQPTIMATANGLPQINIQAPNSHGVSRNQYSQFDVDTRGAILNNSHKNTTSQLGGLVTANPWLSKQEASVILNEVNSRNPSQLNGFIEVAGKRAAVVIANPAGITCDGCGFINASRNTLTTGQVLIENGQLKGFDVNGGRINIEGRGLNDEDVDYTQIIARSVAVNAKIHARELSVVTGKNQVSAEGNVIRVKEGDDATRLEFALDVASIGGMYANKITLTGTEKGVGVRNAGELGASAGELRLSVDGKLENSGRLQSHNTLRIDTTGDQSSSGKMVSRQDLSLSSGGLVRNSGWVSSGANTTLDAMTIHSTPESTLGAGVDSDGKLNRSGNLVLTSEHELKAQGNNLAHDQIKMRGSRVDLAASQTSADAIKLTSTQSDISIAGARVNGHVIRAHASTQLNNDNGKLTAGSLTIEAQEIRNNYGLLQQLNPEALDLNIGLLQNHQGFVINEGDTRLKAQRIENLSGVITGNGDSLRLDAQYLDNQRGTVRGRQVTIDTQQGEVNNASGNLVAQADLKVSGGATNNWGGLIQSVGDLEIHTHGQKLINRESAKAGILSGGALVINSGDIDNQSGVMTAISAAEITSGILTNTDGTLTSKGALSLNTGALKNQRGLLQSDEKLSLDTHGAQLINIASGDRGGIVARGDLQLLTGQIAGEQGTIEGQNLIINTHGQPMNQQAGRLSARGNLQLDSGTLNNRAGRLHSGGDMWLNTQGHALINNNSGASGGAIAGGNLTVHSGDIDNGSGVLVSAGNIQADSGALTNIAGIIVADLALTLKSGRVDNQRGLLQAHLGLSLNTQGAGLNNCDTGESGGIVAGGDLSLSSGHINGSKGLIHGQNIRINTHSQTFDHQHGQLGATGTLQLNSGILNNRSARIESGGDLHLNTQGNILVNSESGTFGGLFSGGKLALNTGAIDNERGSITGNNGALIATGDVNNRAGMLIASKAQFHLTTHKLQNQGGLIWAESDLTLDTQGHTIINSDSGEKRGIVALNNLEVCSGKICNQAGIITAGQQATLSAGELNNSQGLVAGNGGLSYKGQAVDNSEGKLRSEGDVTLNTAGQTLTNLRGLISSSDKIRIDSGTLENRPGQIQGEKDLTINAGQNPLHNQHGKLFSAGTLTLRAGQLINTSGQLLSVDAGTLELSQRVDNSDGLIRGGERMDITTPWLINSTTWQDDKGTEAGKLTVKTTTLNNSQGALRARHNLELTVRQALENVRGLISSTDTLMIQHDTERPALAINNQSGTLIADKKAQIHAASLSGDGQVMSRGNLGIALAGDFHNLSSVKVNGTLRLTADGNITNDGTLAAGQALSLAAQNVNNQATGEINARKIEVRAADSLNNRGLFDGTLACLFAGVLNNIGTGRIFSDRIIIAAPMLNNISEEDKAAVIAARQRLDIAAGTLNNRDHALILSEGDLHLGGQLDGNNRATGQGQQLNNHGATIDSRQDATIAMAEINNTNRHLTTKTVTTEASTRHEAVLKGQTNRFDWHTVNTRKKNKYGVHNARMPDGTNSGEFYEYNYLRTVTETQIMESDPGKILSGGNMTLNVNRLKNQDSQVVAGAMNTGQIGELNNEATKGTRVTIDNGKVVRWYAAKKKRKAGGTKTSQGKDRSNYRPAAVKETIDLKTLSWGADVAPQSNDYQTGNWEQLALTDKASMVGKIWGRRALTAVVLSAADSGSLLLPAGLRYDSALTLEKLGNLKDRPLLLPAGQQFSLTLPETRVNGQAITPVIRAVSADTRLPNNSLYKLHPASDSHYLVETDPRFINHKKWLSSDYMQKLLITDGSKMHKRLADGYYEQRLLRDQIIKLIGNPYINGYHNNEDQFRQLMKNGVAFGNAYQLELGVALTPAQMALLTSDMVWLVNHVVTLPDGSQQTVLVPQVYAKVKQGDLTGDGALFGGGSVSLNTRHDITNSGTLYGRDATQLTVQSLTNSGYIKGNKVSLTAREDITNLGGTLSGDKRLSLLAGRDITSQSTLRGNGNDRWIDRPAGIYVQGSDGYLTLNALNNITLEASDTANAGENSTTRIQAGNDLRLSTRSTQHTENDSWGSNNYRHLSQQTDVGTRITAGGALQLSAKQDIHATAADVTAGGALDVSAGRDILLSAGSNHTELIEHSKQSSKGLLSSMSLETHDELRDRQALSTTLSGDSVRIQAGRDIAVTGSNIAGTQDVALTAGRDLTVTTAAESHQEMHQREEKKSGLMGTGGVGFTAGKAMQKNTVEAIGALSKSSMLGSSDGSVILSAGDRLKLHGSDLIAGQDLTLSASDVTISAAENSYSTLTKTEQKQSGLTLALSGTVGSALNTAVQTARSADNSMDARMKALQGTKAALTAAQAAQAYQLDGAETDAANAKNAAANLKPGDKGYQDGSTNSVGISLSYGSQSSKSETRTESRQSRGSTLGAGRALNITATGAQPGSRGDITVQGSQLQAGGDIGLQAKNDISLRSAQNSERTDSTNSSKGGSVGVALTAGSGGYGLNVSASVNASKGSANGNGTTHTGSTLTAGRGLSLSAGRDTQLQGAQVRGESVKVKTGRNLTLASEQDSDRYDSKQQSVSAGASYTFGSMTGSASVNLSRDKMRSNWQSVTEQTGIFAGQGGFDVTVGGHTQLDGAVISSTAAADKNRLDTGTLGFSDIENHASYKVEHQSVGMSTGGSIGGQFAGNMANNLLSGSNNSDSASSTTKAAVSKGSIIIRDRANQRQDVAVLSDDTESANPGLDKIFNKEKQQRRIDTAQLIAEIGSQVSDIARTQGKLTATREATQAVKQASPSALAAAKAEWTAAHPGREPTKADIQQQVYETAYNQAFRDTGLGTGGDYQQVISAATAAVEGLAGGNLGQALSGAAAPYLAEVIHHQTTAKDPDGKEVVNVKANLIAHAAVGAITSWASGKAALAGAAGAVIGEYTAQQLCAGVEREKLSEEQRQTISALGTLAGGLAGGLTGGNTGSAITGAQSGKNAVENNFLNGNEARAFDKEWQACQETGGDCKAVADKYQALSDKNYAELQQICADSPLTCASYQKQLVDNGMDAATRPDWMPDWLGAPMRDETARGYVQSANAKALEHISQNTDKWDRLGAFIAEPENVVGLVGTAKSLFKDSATKTAKATGTAMSLGANAGVQVYEGKTGEKFDYTTLLTSGVTGASGVGKSLNSNIGLNVGGAYFSSQVNGEDSQAAMIGAAGGTALGFGVGTGITNSWEAKLIKEHFGMSASKNALNYSETTFGPGYLFKESKLNAIPGISGGFVGAATTEVSSSFVQEKSRK